ncbi:MAG: type I-MYXAN CRISPR-associated protein Cas6/Cmx6 [Pseudomonadota bacterium]|nr:type I-MYXAN CRISPR-associated protein Cas6/Cmx6 [Pseudomonadota bacterium]
MYWTEQTTSETYRITDDVVDVVFAISCRCLPVDHAQALREGLQRALPWLAAEEGAGIHPLHGAESGNGWMRPDNPDDLLYLSRRTKLVLRLPKQRVADAGVLSGREIEIMGNRLAVGASSIRPLSPITTIFSRYVVMGGPGDEQVFVADIVRQLGEMGIRPKKMLCGMEKAIATPQGGLRARSLMLADLSVDESVRLQQRGLGPERQLGCGLFIPHKDVDEVRGTER